MGANSRVFARPVVIHGCGGFGKVAAAGVVANILGATGEIDPNLIARYADFEGRQLTVAELVNAGIPSDIIDRIRPAAADIIEIGRSATDLRLILDRIKSNDAKYTWLNRVLPFAMVEKLLGASEAARLKAYGRWCVAVAESKQSVAATGGIDTRLSARLGEALDRLRPGGEASSALALAGHTGLPHRVIVAIVAGANGGTGNSLAEMSALFVHDYGHRKGIPVEVHLHYLAGEYVDHGAESDIRLAIGGLAAEQFEDSQIARLREVPVGPATTWRHTGPLFDRVFRHSTGHGSHVELRQIVQSAARSIAWALRSAAAHQVTQGWSNMEAAARIVA